MGKIVLASSNQGKLAEFKIMLADSGLNIIPQSEFNISDADETGLTFVENAILKARHASQACGLPALADDSGLEVDALDGAPGVFSARYAQEHGNFKANIEKVLSELKDVPEAKRTARFQCVLAYLLHPRDPSPIISQGTWQGRILFEPTGTQGFGYDPIFYVPTHDCSAAELPEAEKNRISHRHMALEKLLGYLGTKK